MCGSHMYVGCLNIQLRVANIRMWVASIFNYVWLTYVCGLPQYLITCGSHTYVGCLNIQLRVAHTTGCEGGFNQEPLTKADCIYMLHT